MITERTITNFMLILMKANNDGFQLFFLALCGIIGVIIGIIYSIWKIYDTIKTTKRDLEESKARINEKDNSIKSLKADKDNSIKSLKADIETLKTEINTLEIENDKFSKFLGLNKLYNNGEGKHIFLSEITSILNKEDFEKTKEIILLKNRVKYLESTQSNLTAIPYMAKIVADYESYGFEHLASQLDWGTDKKRLKKVEDIRFLRNKCREIIEQNKDAEYQLAYLTTLYPILREVIETDYQQLPRIDIEKDEYDHIRDYLSTEEYNSLSQIERNQLALDRYIESRHKSKWQIGRDYELYIGYLYEQQGAHVDYFGSNMGLDDLGRDLIIEDKGKIIIVQCKYWSSKKLIHENHIHQLYGTIISYKVEHGELSDVEGVLITNICLSDTAKKIANYLDIKYKENIPIGDFPRIKCNLGKDEYGWQTKIYHLPFDQQYDSVKINKQGEFMALTVKEAEAAGFRRAYRWHGN